MKKTGLYDSLQIASRFIEQAEKLAKSQDFDAAFAMLEKAKSYAFNNDAMLDNIQSHSEALSNARRHYLRQLEEEAAKLFNQEPFDSQKAREILQLLRQQDKQNEIAQSLWTELQLKEAAERERRLVEEFQQELEKIWLQAYELERRGAGSSALAEYERAIIEASKKVGDTPEVIPLQRLKLLAQKKYDGAKEKWEAVPALIQARKGPELVDYYESLKSQGETETEFFDENGEFAGCLPIDDCVSRAKTLANRFAEQQAQDYLDQARKLLIESPRAAYDKIQEALGAIPPHDTAKRMLEQELKEKIQPALMQREKALRLLEAALSKEEPVEVWQALDQVEQLDRFTPGLGEARQQLASLLQQKLAQLLGKGYQLQDLEELEMAQARFKEVIETGETVASYNEALRELHTQAHEALARCLQRQQAVQAFEAQLVTIAELSQTEPEQAHEALAQLKIENSSDQELAKIERLQVEIDFRLGVDRLFHSLEQKMLAVSDPVELISIEEGAKQACTDYPDEVRFPRLVERIIARRAFLQGSAWCEDPEQYVEAMDLLRKVVKLKGDDADTAQNLLDKIAANEQQEADIAIAMAEAIQALDNEDARSAFLLLQPFRYAASRHAVQVRELISTATTRWRNDIEQQLEALVAAEAFILPKVEFLIQELERAQAPGVEEWRVKALAPAYAITAQDLQDLDRWDEAELLWEEAFRLSSKTPHIAEGRRNAQKHNALTRVQTTIDPAEKERLLDHLSRTYSNDPVIKRYLAAFYYGQKRYTEAQLVLSQAKLLLDQLDAPMAEAEYETIRHMETRIQDAQEIEKRTVAIRNQLRGDPSLKQLKEARLAYEALTKIVPEQAERLQRGWEKLTEAKVNKLKSELAEISEKAGTIWARVELLCKILVLQADPQIQGQAQRLFKLAYDQLQPEIKMAIDNPEGVGYGSAEAALENHSARIKALHDRVVEMNQLGQIMAGLELQIMEHEQLLDETLYNLELILGKLFLIQEKRRELKQQMSVAMVTGKWDAVEDGLKELEIKGWHQHRGVKELPEEVKEARQKRSELETSVEQIKSAMAQEKFTLVQEHLATLAEKDPEDETRLQATLEVVDPYSGNKIKGAKQLGSLLTEKLALFQRLSEWQAEGQSSINWPIVRSKILKFANQGGFKAAIELAQAAVGQNDNPGLLREETWSLERLRQHLETFPLTQAEINSRYAKNLFDEVGQKSQILEKQMGECTLMLEELEQKEKELKQIFGQLKPLLQRLNERKNFLSSIFAPSAEVEEAKQQIRELVGRGRQLCPEHPGFADFDESIFSKR